MYLRSRIARAIKLVARLGSGPKRMVPPGELSEALALPACRSVSKHPPTVAHTLPDEVPLMSAPTLHTCSHRQAGSLAECTTAIPQAESTRAIPQAECTTTIPQAESTTAIGLLAGPCVEERLAQQI
jgi:hypothetical protein